ncbi:MAG: universal stress protein [Thermoleophilaceae bacterium]|nr:universal stress protein [Thermoleophilaceae bacterium]
MALPGVFERVITGHRAGPRDDDALALAGLLAADPSGVLTVTVESGAAATGLERAAREEGADLIVLGTSRRGRVGQIMAGGVALRLLHGAPCAVAIAPAGVAEHGGDLAAIGVGYDGGAESDAALSLAARLALAKRARLEVLAVASHGYTDARLEVVPGQTRPAPATDDLEPLVAGAVEGLPDGLEVTATVVGGDPVEVLAERSGELDLLVLGSRRHAPVTGVLLGSVASELALEAGCALLVVPPPG